MGKNANLHNQLVGGLVGRYCFIQDFWKLMRDTSKMSTLFFYRKVMSYFP